MFELVFLAGQRPATQQSDTDGQNMNDTQPASSPFALNNIRMFIAFRVFFNARFYYPVFTILFLDFGLTISQFAILNAVWAGTIVLMEVPSGALADIWGRRNLLILSSLLMIVELLLLCIVPLGHPTLLFAIFLVNRVLSGTAEAAASGADEAIAFDSLKEAGLAGRMEQGPGHANAYALHWPSFSPWQWQGQFPHS